MDQLEKLLPPGAGDWFPRIAFAAAVVVVLWIAWRVVFRRRSTKSPQPPPMLFEAATLDNSKPPPGPPSLEFYNLPVRLAAVVLAPAGLGSELPPDENLGPLLDAIVPGLDKVAALHKPIVRRWPNQVSSSGFAHQFFRGVQLPGDHGKGSAWSAVAGLAKHKNRPFMVGLVLRADRPNSFGQTVVGAETQWLGCLRVRWS